MKNKSLAVRVAESDSTRMLGAVLMILFFVVLAFLVLWFGWQVFG